MREPIWRALLANGESESQPFRTSLLQKFGLDPTSARHVNYYAWSLVDLLQNGFVESFDRIVPGKRGRMRNAKF